ncbi:hypothetical protein GCM10023175_03570 [Pseudonocardia xishanensis]|uniref:DDE superfamily endonuclease n=1 Tax=Pseudonocardia xishanensis TaxID=630995 RepID=A0ABP8REH0_9PSEU
MEPRRRVGAYLRGLLAGLERRNGWTLAEHAGAVSPDGMQRLLRTAGWDVDGVRDDLRVYVLENLGERLSDGLCNKILLSRGVHRCPWSMIRTRIRSVPALRSVVSPRRPVTR